MIAITCKSRKVQKKGDVKRLRREGHIPFVMYSKGKSAEAGSVPQSEIAAAMRKIPKGFLPTTVFVMKDEQGQDRKVVVREVQYAPTTYEVVHIDFMELNDATKVEVKIPIELTNTVDCVGVKLGGFLQTVMRHVKVKCFPKDMMSHFEIDVKDLDIHQSRRVSDLVLPAGVTCTEAPKNVLVTVCKK